MASERRTDLLFFPQTLPFLLCFPCSSSFVPHDRNATRLSIYRPSASRILRGEPLFSFLHPALLPLPSFLPPPTSSPAQ